MEGSELEDLEHPSVVYAERQNAQATSQVVTVQSTVCNAALRVSLYATVDSRVLRIIINWENTTQHRPETSWVRIESTVTACVSFAGTSRMELVRHAD